MKTLYYGVTSVEHLFGCAAKAVHVFGGEIQHIQLLMGTVCTETDLCTFRDSHPDKWGVGCPQFDSIRFYDVIKRTRKDNRHKFYRAYGVRLADLVLSDIARNPEIAMAMCRLAYILIPALIPKSRAEQAQYWKTHWNTYAINAKGNVECYLKDWRSFMPNWV